MSTDSQVGGATPPGPLTRNPQISNLMNGKKIVSFHSAPVKFYKTFRLTSESREVGGGAGNLFVCLSLLETIINYGLQSH